MQKVFVGAAILRCRIIKYYLITTPRDSTQKTYGAMVEYLGEKVSISDISISLQNVLTLIRCMHRGRVTPATARDIVEDWLAL